MSKISQANIIIGKIKKEQISKIESYMPIFSDGRIDDFLVFYSGSIAGIGIVAPKGYIDCINNISNQS